MFLSPLCTVSLGPTDLVCVGWVCLVRGCLGGRCGLGGRYGVVKVVEGGECGVIGGKSSCVKSGRNGFCVSVGDSDPATKEAFPCLLGVENGDVFGDGGDGGDGCVLLPQGVLLSRSSMRRRENISLPGSFLPSWFLEYVPQKASGTSWMSLTPVVPSKVLRKIATKLNFMARISLITDVWVLVHFAKFGFVLSCLDRSFAAYASEDPLILVATSSAFRNVAFVNW